MSDISLMISSGAGPRECEYAAHGIAKAFQREAKSEGINVNLLDNDNPGSFTLRLSGANAEAFASARCGTIRWVGQSPFRKNHKRKNWFVGVSRLPELTDIQDIKDSDIRYSATRASGPGGQHVNKTNSAVRAVHLPTGIAVAAQEERSQYANKKLCRIKLAAIMASDVEQQQINYQKSKWKNHKTLERGNPIRTYQGGKFKLKF